jgi:hypothetical protein
MNDVQATPHIDDKATCEALNEIVSAYLEDAARRAGAERACGQRPTLFAAWKTLRATPGWRWA